MPSPDSSANELDCISQDEDNALHAMLAGIDHVYSGQVDDFLPYDDALEYAFESVVQHALKAEQEHSGEPKSISEVMQLAPD